MIKTDGLETWCSQEQFKKNIAELSSQDLLERCHRAGIIGFGGAGFPTAMKLSKQKMDTLIINGVECEPLITADDRLMQERSSKICEGSLLLQKITGAKKNHSCN